MISALPIWCLIRKVKMVQENDGGIEKVVVEEKSDWRGRKILRVEEGHSLELSLPKRKPRQRPQRRHFHLQNGAGDVN
jgi:hypothetical protein